MIMTIKCSERMVTSSVIILNKKTGNLILGSGSLSEIIMEVMEVITIIENCHRYNSNGPNP